MFNSSSSGSSGDLFFKHISGGPIHVDFSFRLIAPAGADSVHTKVSQSDQIFRGDFSDRSWGFTEWVTELELPDYVHNDGKVELQVTITPRSTTITAVNPFHLA
jgi:hypothetical protein